MAMTQHTGRQMFWSAVKGMFKTRFLRNSFFLTLILLIVLPMYTMLITYPSFRDLLTRFTEEHAIQLANHLTELVVMHEQNGEKKTLSLKVTSEFTHKTILIADTFHLYKYRLFDASGRIVHSSHLKEIGTLNTHAYFKEVIAKGNVFSNVVQKNHQNMENEKLTIDVVETYVPIIVENQFLGAFEIYFDITKWRKQMDAIVTQASMMLLIILSGFFIVILTTRYHVMQRVMAFMLAISKTAAGEFQHQIAMTGRDELTDMAKGFNLMSKELFKLHQGLQHEKNKLTTIILSAREGIVVTDSNGSVVLVNPSAERLLGKDLLKIQQDGFLSIVDDPDFMSRFLECNGKDMPEIFVYNHHVLQFYTSWIHNTEGIKVGAAALLRDITAEKNLETQLRNQSITDVLTGLYNRRHANEVLTAEMRRFQRSKIQFAFVMLDVDHFKRFNDQHGHDQGDRVLQSVAKMMIAHYRQIDICCRFGGEEFCVIMPGTNRTGAIDAASRLRERIEEMEVDGLKVTVSIGIALSEAAIQVEQLVKQADNALYTAKQRGRNQVIDWQEVEKNG